MTIHEDEFGEVPENQKRERSIGELRAQLNNPDLSEYDKQIITGKIYTMQQKALEMLQQENKQNIPNQAENNAYVNLQNQQNINLQQQNNSCPYQQMQAQNDFNPNPGMRQMSTYKNIQGSVNDYGNYYKQQTPQFQQPQQFNPNQQPPHFNPNQMPDNNNDPKEQENMEKFMK